MHVSLINLLVSPRGGEPLKLVDELRDGDDILKGSLICERTTESFPIRNGIPYLAPEAINSNATAQRFGYQWKKQAAGAFEQEAIYGESSSKEFENFLRATELTIDHLPGLRIADVGCGRGRLSRKIAEMGAEVFAIDISNSVEVVRAEGLHTPRLHVIQSDLFRLPFRANFFNVIRSDGVIHHTHDPSAAFGALASKIAVGGRLSIYVYPQELSIYKLFRYCTPLSYRWPLSTLQMYTSVAAGPIYLARIITRRQQPFREVKFRLFDTLACPYLWMHSKEQVKAWFQENQFDQIKFMKPDITALGTKRTE